MPVVIESRTDTALEEHAMRKSGMLGRGTNANSLFTIDYRSLPPAARTVLDTIIAGGPFLYPGKDGSNFGNRFGDLPSGTYLEFTVPTPGVTNRGKRRIVARKTTGQVFFTACHYERLGAKGGSNDQKKAALQVAYDGLDEEWRNGFYLVTGMDIDLRNQLRDAIRAL